MEGTITNLEAKHSEAVKQLRKASEEKEKSLTEMETLLGKSQQMLDERNNELLQLKADNAAGQEALANLQSELKSERESRELIEQQLKAITSDLEDETLLTEEMQRKIQV